ncbi:Peptidase C12 ubiquitin carboxyl-terminal hydrolase [Trinorchestia longiramus]|nr:Peptidase C12 ubiquitin carboxyl-terminal hydrolase [Trinorchestia longiramus]
MASSRWVPLESNPEFLTGLGVPETTRVCDVLGLDEELLALVPRPVYALLLLYPLTDKSEGFKAEQESAVEEAGQDLSENLYYMKQYIGNACGAVALIHALANNKSISYDDGPLKDFLEKTASMDPEARGHELEANEGLAAIHESCASDGQTAAPNREDHLDTHFIAFVNVDNTLYELDGRKKFPINHGSTSEETFIIDGANILRSFMERDPKESRFAVLALAAAE